jgi:hypothetical protein
MLHAVFNILVTLDIKLYPIRRPQVQKPTPKIFMREQTNDYKPVRFVFISFEILA